MSDEAPYLAEFISHYLSLGFERVYYINTSETHEYLRDVLSADVRAHLSVIDLPNTTPDWQDYVLDEVRRTIREDWFLSVDVDEFLHLGNRNIHEFLASLPSGVVCVQLPWLMCLSTRYTQASVFDIRHDHVAQSRLYKCLARTEFVTECGIHDIATAGGQMAFAPTAYGDRAFILHFACRGFLDLVNRIVDRNYENDKSGPEQVSKLIAFFSDDHIPLCDYPFRFNLYRIELSFPRQTVDLSDIHFHVRAGTDNALLQQLFQAKMSRIGLRLPADLGDANARAFDATFRLRERLLSNLPDSRFARMHLDDRVSYVNITRAYLDSVRMA